MANKHTGFSQIARFVQRHILRNGFKTALVVFLAMIFIIGLTSINLAIINNGNDLEVLYKTITVNMDLVKLSSMSGENGFIYGSTIDRILETGYIESYYTQGDMFLRSITHVTGDISDTPKRGTVISNCPVVTFDDVNAFTERYSGLDITYLDGFDESIFADDRKYDEGSLSPVIVPRALFDIYASAAAAENGESETVTDVGYLEFSVNSDNRVYKRLYKIAGVYDGLISIYEPNYIIIPTSALLNWFKDIGNESLMLYSVADFTVDPEKNRDIQAFREAAQEIASDEHAGTGEMRALIWDSELRMVAEPMENSIRLLKILYPVVLAVSALIAAGVCVLFTMLSAKDAAIMRVQGTSKARVRLMLTLQMVFTCIIGLIIGLLGMYVYMHFSGQASVNDLFIETLRVTILYLSASLLGAGVTSVFVTNKHPIELLQVKE